MGEMAGEETASVSDVDVGVKRVYRKRSEQKRTSSSSLGGGTTAVRVPLTKLSDEDVANRKMANAFGDTTKSAMRVNPLFEKDDGTIEVEASELRRPVKNSEATSNGGVRRPSNQTNGSVKTVSQNVPMMQHEGGASPPPVAYGGNFHLKEEHERTPRTNPRGGPGPPGDRRVGDLERVFPARIQKNSYTPRSYDPPTIAQSSPFTTPRQSVITDTSISFTPSPASPVTKSELEHAMRRARIQRWWRCVIGVILATLFFVLILVLVIVFTTR